MQGCPSPPPTPPTPDAAYPRSHRGAAGRLSAGTHCWCGTACCAAARGKLMSNLGCASGRTTCRDQPTRHRTRRSAGSPRTRPHSRACTSSSGRRTAARAYEVFEASRVSSVECARNVCAAHLSLPATCPTRAPRGSAQRPTQGLARGGGLKPAAKNTDPDISAGVHTRCPVVCARCDA